MKKKCKKAIALFLSVTLLSMGSAGGSQLAMGASRPFIIYSASDVNSGRCGDDASWTLKNGVLTISGTGQIDDGRYYGNSYYSIWQEMQVESVVVKEGITGIGKGTFAMCSEMQSIVLPSSVQSIGEVAFGGCKKLKQIDIPKGVTSIGATTFGQCNSLTSVNIPEGVTRIGKYAFNGCDSLASVYLPSSLLEIGEQAFLKCVNLTDVNLPKKVAIGNMAFGYCSSLSYVDIPAGVDIGFNAFCACENLTSVDIAAGVNIGGSAFSACGKLRDVNMSDGVTGIGGGAFEQCKGLEEIHLPNGITRIEERTFSSCSNLRNISIPASVKSIGYQLFPRCDSLAEVRISEGVESIEMYAFSNCKNLTTVYFPSSVTRVEDGIFYNSNKLSDIYYGGTKEQWASLNIEVPDTTEIHYSSAFIQPDETGSNPYDPKNPLETEPGTPFEPSDETEPTIPDVSPGEIGDNTDDRKDPSDGAAYLLISQDSIAVTASGTASVSRIDVDTRDVEEFSVSCSADWIEIEEFVSEGYFHVDFDKNPSYQSRSASIIVSDETGTAHKTVTVEQSGVEPYLDVDKTSVSVYSDGSADGMEQCVQVTTKDTGGYTAVADDGCGWLRISNKPEGEYGDSLSAMTFSGSCSFWISVAENRSGNVRTGKIFVRHESGGISKTVTVTQEGRDIDTLEVSSEYVQFDSSDTGMELIDVYAGDDLQWTAKSTVGWIYVMNQNASSRKSSIHGTGSTGFYIYTKKNKSSKTRDGYVRISADGFKDIEIYVRQPAREKTSGELLRSLIVSVTKKTMYVGQKTKVRFQYPEGMYASDIRKIQYFSNKKKVASVSKGVIRGKKKGKATISVKVTATDNTTKIFKIKIVVDKRLSASSS